MVTSPIDIWSRLMMKTNIILLIVNDGARLLIADGLLLQRGCTMEECGKDEGARRRRPTIATGVSARSSRKRKLPPPVAVPSRSRVDAGTTTTPTHRRWSAAFPAALIKSALQEEEGVGMLLKPAVDLVGACSALFVRNLLAHTVARSSPSSSSAAEPSGKAAGLGVLTLATADGLRQTIAENEEFQFLDGVLDGLEEERDAARSSTSILMSDVRKKTKPITAAVAKKPKDKKLFVSRATGSRLLVKEAVLHAAGVDDDVAETATAIQTEIVVDDEDYD